MTKQEFCLKGSLSIFSVSNHWLVLPARYQTIMLKISEKDICVHSVCCLFRSSSDKRNVTCSTKPPECWHYSTDCCAPPCSLQPRLLLAKSQDAAFCLQASTAAPHACMREESDPRLWQSQHCDGVDCVCWWTFDPGKLHSYPMTLTIALG